MSSNDAELLRRINELSGAIQQHRLNQSSNRGRGFARGMWPPRGRGRGGSYNLTLHNAGTTRSGSYNRTLGKTGAAATLPFHSHNMTLNNTIPKPSYSPHAVISRPPLPPPPPPMIPNPSSPIARPSPHRKLINNTAVPIVQSTTPTGERSVTIDGINFIVKGRKLIRQDRLSNRSLPPTIQPGSLIRLRRRTSKRKGITTPGLKRSKQGNMVYIPGPQSEGYVRQGKAGKTLVLKEKQQQQTKTYCGIYTRYGKCKKGARCPFIHDPSRRAVCPWFLKNECKKPAGQCRLSHEPTPEVMPHCSYFQRGSCTRESCMFMHVHVRPDAPVCRAFAVEGYCSKGLACKNKHVHVCPEFAATGKCSNANCLMPHVARRTKEQSGVAGVASLRSWVSAKYLHEQKTQQQQQKQQQQQRRGEDIGKQEQQRTDERSDTVARSQQEEEEEEGFVRLFDDNDDEGWSQYQIKEDDGQELRFSEEQEEEDENNDNEQQQEEEYKESSEESMDEDDDYEEYEIEDQND